MVGQLGYVFYIYFYLRIRGAYMNIFPLIYNLSVYSNLDVPVIPFSPTPYITKGVSGTTGGISKYI